MRCRMADVQSTSSVQDGAQKGVSANRSCARAGEFRPGHYVLSLV